MFFNLALTFYLQAIYVLFEFSSRLGLRVSCTNRFQRIRMVENEVDLAYTLESVMIQIRKPVWRT